MVLDDMPTQLPTHSPHLSKFAPGPRPADAGGAQRDVGGDASIGRGARVSPPAARGPGMSVEMQMMCIEGNSADVSINQH